MLGENNISTEDSDDKLGLSILGHLGVLPPLIAGRCGVTFLTRLAGSLIHTQGGTEDRGTSTM